MYVCGISMRKKRLCLFKCECVVLSIQPPSDDVIQGSLAFFSGFVHDTWLLVEEYVHLIKKYCSQMQ